MWSLGVQECNVCPHPRSDIQERKAAEEIVAAAKRRSLEAQREAEAAVLAEQRLLSTVLEQLPIAVFVITQPNADLKLFNARAREVWGAPDSGGTSEVESHRASRTGCVRG